MGNFTLLLLALGLSMDAFAVSVSNAMCFKALTRKQAFANSLAFGVFQGGMPVVGFFAGRLFEGFVTAVDHWIALVLLGFIGGKMVAEGIRALHAPESCPAGQTFSVKTMLVQAVATSIDALAVGISFAALAVNVWLAAGAIALLTFAICVAGSAIGRKFGALLGDWAKIVGGVVLAGIGLRIFIEHMLGL